MTSAPVLQFIDFSSNGLAIEISSDDYSKLSKKFWTSTELNLSKTESSRRLTSHTDPSIEISKK